MVIGILPDISLPKGSRAVTMTGVISTNCDIISDSQNTIRVPLWGETLQLLRRVR